MDSFPLLEAPAILQSDNGTEFIDHVISEMKDFQPAWVMVHSKPHHPQSQGSVERANGDIKDMLVAWLADKDTDEWVTGIKFVQFQKNSAHHSGIKRSPYSALFCEEVRVGLTTSLMPQEVLSKLDSKEDLLDVIMDQPSEEPSSTNIRSSALRFQCSSHPPFPGFQPSSVSMGVCSVNLVVPEGTDTEKVTDMSVIVITEQTFDVRSTQIKRCRAFTYTSCVSQA